MKRVKHFCRALLNFFLLAVLCGSFAFPAVNVQAAPGLQVAVDVVISEFRTRGPAGATDEFIELYNPTSSPVSVGGWKVNASNNTGSTGTRATIPNLTVLQSGQYYLIANTSYSGTVSPNLTYGSGIADNGGIALLRSDSSIADQVGMSSGSAYKEGTILTPLNGSSDQSYERKLGGSSDSCTDTDDNLPDFANIAPSSPHNLGSPLSLCGVILPTPTSTATATATNTPTDTPTPTLTPTSALPRSVIINEIAWGGTAGNFTDEWFELYNTAGTDISLTGWHLTADGGSPNIALTGTIGAGKYFVFAKSSSVFKNFTPDQINSGISFNNSGQMLSLTDSFGTQVDTANMDGGPWPAGSGAPTFQTMERKGNVADTPTAWATYGGSGSSVLDRNSNPVMGTPGQGNWALTITPTPTPTATGTATPTGTATKTGTPTTGPSILINEVAWSGTSASSSDEWIELYNPGNSSINITGWKLYGDDNSLNKVGSPNITLSGTIPADGYFLLERDEQATDVSANQVYGSGDLLNTGERLYLKDDSGNTIDTANLDGSSWPAGTASTTSTSPPAYASMERVGKTGNQWVTYNGTVPLAHDRNSGPIRGTPGKANWIRTASITTITSDTPDPSVVNQYVNVVVSVVGGITTPTGSVSITGANTNCTITLSNGTGSCQVRFTSTGTKTITATYTSTSGLPPSNDTESHQVATSGTIFYTPTPVPIPPPQLVVINEFVPRPGHDWNGDGVVNVGDEYIELLNHGTVDVNLSGYRLDDEVNIGSNPYSLPAKVVKPGERVVFYGSETGLLLGDGGDGVRLLKPNGQLMDAYNYTVVRYADQSYCRLPDNGGADDWNQNCFPTPGLQNSLSGNIAVPSGSVGQESLCPIADTLPFDFVRAECEPFGNNIWRPDFWDRTGWYNEKYLPMIDGKWPIFAD